MKFDTIIIGGGLTGLLCGVRLQESGRNCAIISTGQSAMHFWSGAFDILNRLPDGTDVDYPRESMGGLPSSHPYSVIGTENVFGYLGEALRIFADCGCRLDSPEDGRNIFRVSSAGSLKRCYLTLPNLLTVKSDTESICRRALVANLDGFLDFNTEFVAKCIEDSGSPCRTVTICVDALSRLRKSPTEMRATNISKVIDRQIIKEMVSQTREKYDGEDLIVFPAIFHTQDSADASQLGKLMNTRVRFVATMPPSVPGIEIQMGLVRRFRSLGGTLFKGDTVVSGEFSGDRLVSVTTANIPDIGFKADSFVLASGSFFSNGLMSDRTSVWEPALGVDVEYPADRKDWFDGDEFFSRQNYISFGVRTAEGTPFKVLRNGETVGNLHAAGAILSGCNALYEGCGGGVAISSTLYVADAILGNEPGK